MPDLQLTKDFRLREFAVSAEHPELANMMRFTELEATKLFYLCSFILQPLRQLVGRPIHILSGKRTPELNEAIGGSKTSQHLVCEATDFVVEPSADGAELPHSSPDNRISANEIPGGRRGDPAGRPGRGTASPLQDAFEFMAKNWVHLWHQLIIYYVNGMRPRFIHVSIPPTPVYHGPFYPKRKGAFYHHKGQFYKVELK